MAGESYDAGDVSPGSFSSTAAAPACSSCRDATGSLAPAATLGRTAKRPFARNWVGAPPDGSWRPRSPLPVNSLNAAPILLIMEGLCRDGEDCGGGDDTRTALAEDDSVCAGRSSAFRTHSRVSVSATKTVDMLTLVKTKTNVSLVSKIRHELKDFSCLRHSSKSPKIRKKSTNFKHLKTWNPR